VNPDVVTNDTTWNIKSILSILCDCIPDEKSKISTTRLKIIIKNDLASELIK
jgi:predicted GTPase